MLIAIRFLLGLFLACSGFLFVSKVTHLKMSVGWTRWCTSVIPGAPEAEAGWFANSRSARQSRETLLKIE
jgi:hypothetical protein